MQSNHTLSIKVSICGVVLAAALLPGCGSREAQVPEPEVTKGPPQVSQEVIQKHQPNEAGAVMAVMYHRFVKDEPDNDLNRKPDSFRDDLKLLYDNNYHPVTALEFVENQMHVPAGKTPVVITFDDALPTQFRVLNGSDGKPHIDPNSAVGIMETFNKEHPEWPTKATFFVLPKAGRNSFPFGQSEFVADKFAYLEKHGYEIANHTATHSSLRSMAPDKVAWELATAKKLIGEVSPKATLSTLALPYGQLPRREEARAKLQKGESGGVGYENKAVFLAAWRPNMSPVTKKDESLTNGGKMAVFDPFNLERVKADARQAKEPGTFEYWLKYFKENPSQRYVSDGLLEVVTVPAAQKSAVDAARVQAQGKILQTYGAGGAGGADGAGGEAGVTDLSVR